MGEEKLGGGFKYFFFSPLVGEIDPIWTRKNIFRWVGQPPTRQLPYEVVVLLPFPLSFGSTSDISRSVFLG